MEFVTFAGHCHTQKATQDGQSGFLYKHDAQNGLVIWPYFLHLADE